MARVAFATYRQAPELSDDDRLVADVLARRGVEVRGAAWNATDVDWTGADLVVIRSAWDFHLDPTGYEAWLRSFLDRPGRLWNPPAVVLDNLNKRYLVELARQGIDVVPTVHVAKGAGR